MKKLIDRFIRSIPYFQELADSQYRRIRDLESENYELLHSECDHCKLLQGQLDYERERTTQLLSLLTPNRSYSTKESSGTKSWNTLQHELEAKALKAKNDRRIEEE